ncbi:Secologanin synthase [Hordeum vulgare]|nr:Secologanin synthase [Hordeum vulgare]
MTSSRFIRSGLCSCSVVVPFIGFPDCGNPVKFYSSTTKENDGWVFYKYIKHAVIVGNVGVDAIGATKDRREELERKRAEANAGRRIAGRGMARRGNACRVSFGSPSEKNFATKQQATMLLGLGREILMVMKQVLANVMVLCFIFVM